MAVYLTFVSKSGVFYTRSDVAVSEDKCEAENRVRSQNNVRLIVKAAFTSCNMVCLKWLKFSRLQNSRFFANPSDAGSIRTKSRIGKEKRLFCSL